MVGMVLRYNHYSHSDIWAVGNGDDFHDYTPLNDGLWILYHSFMICAIPIAVMLNLFCYSLSPYSD
eukprot:1982633-Amphidinium_carterae.1